MKLVVGAIAIALCAQACAAEEVDFLPSDRVRYRLDANADWQIGMFQSISAQGLVFATHAEAPLDTLPLIALNAVELDRGKHVDGSRFLFLSTLGFLFGGVIGALWSEPVDCVDICFVVVNEPALIGAGVGLAIGLGVGLIPVRQWERVHGGPEPRRSNPWSSRGLVVKYRF